MVMHVFFLSQELNNLILSFRVLAKGLLHGLSSCQAYNLKAFQNIRATYEQELSPFILPVYICIIIWLLHI